MAKKAFEAKVAGASLDGSVLVVDDDPAVRQVVQALLVQAGIEVAAASSGREALGMLEDRPVDVMITDLNMPEMDGMTLLGRVNAQWPAVPVVILTAHGTVPVAVEAMKRGACDFVLKPFDRDELLFVVRKAIAKARHAESSGSSADPPISRPASECPEGSSRVMKECQALIARAAQGQATVLLRGESGTGKEVAARAVHALSPRRAGPFVRVHCGALPDALLESELFGHERGAFTGAIARKPGRVELAQGGTLFLDEIGDITAAVQVKLLRLLQEREFERLGGLATIKADVRFIAATHRNLEGMVARGEFREDLFYRLSVVPIWLPPLRERVSDIEVLATQFCSERAAANGRPEVTLDASALARLAAEPWPGNVRQLQNFVERLVVLSEGRRIGAADVERELSCRAPGPSEAPVTSDPGVGGAATGHLDEQRKMAEREALESALRRAGGNRSLAARLLGVSRRTLYNKLEEFGLA
jgi:two-component system response regulator AtoC